MLNNIEKLKRCIKNIFGRHFKFTYSEVSDDFEEYINVSVEYNGKHVGNVIIEIDDNYSVYCEEFVLQEILCAHFAVDDLCDVHLFQKIHKKYKY